MQKNLKGQAAIQRRAEKPSLSGSLRGQTAIQQTPVKGLLNRSQHGQAAIEYLMTYGWAILALAIVLVVLFSSGIFSPSYLISEECNIGPKIPCKFIFYKAGNDLKMGLSINNGFGYKIKVENLVVTLTDTNQQFTISNSTKELSSGETVTFEGQINGLQIPTNTIKKAKAEITYFSCASEVNPSCDEQMAQNNEGMHLLTGRIIGRVN